MSKLVSFTGQSNYIQTFRQNSTILFCYIYTFINPHNNPNFVLKYPCLKGGGGMPNRNDNKFRKIESESQKQGKSMEEYAKELEMNKLKSQKRK